jgi:hypothetical protein
VRTGFLFGQIECQIEKKYFEINIFVLFLLYFAKAKSGGLRPAGYAVPSLKRRFMKHACGA